MASPASVLSTVQLVLVVQPWQTPFPSFVQVIVVFPRLQVHFIPPPLVLSHLQLLKPSHLQSVLPPELISAVQPTQSSAYPAAGAHTASSAKTITNLASFISTISNKPMLMVRCT